MRNLLSFILICICVISWAQTDSILFLGNSYTSTSNVPGTFKSLAESAGKSVYIESYTPGGKQLNQHASDATTLAKINSKKWDYIILQEQSQMPLINPGNTRFYAQQLVQTIKTNHLCTEPIIYMTWARKEGNSWLTQIGYTHEQMASYYEEFYGNVFEWTTGRVSPVGSAFHEATRRGINIYSGDGSHQNSDGTYLAACVFYATVFKESPIGLTYNSASSSLLKDTFQEIASDIVLKDLYSLNINKVKFEFSDSNIEKGESVTFSEWIYVYDYPPTFEWTFDGAVTINSDEANPTVFYNNDGINDVSLTITTGCFSETRILPDTIKVGSITGLNDLHSTSSIDVYPTLSKTNDILYVKKNSEELALTLHNTQGQLIDFQISDENELLFKKTKGIYYFSAEDQSTSRFIITE